MIVEIDREITEQNEALPPKQDSIMQRLLWSRLLKVQLYLVGQVQCTGL
jgi:hypothetical protein